MDCGKKAVNVPISYIPLKRSVSSVRSGKWYNIVTDLDQPLRVGQTDACS